MPRSNNLEHQTRTIFAAALRQGEFALNRARTKRVNSFVLAWGTRQKTREESDKCSRDVPQRLQMSASVLLKCSKWLLFGKDVLVGSEMSSNGASHCSILGCSILSRRAVLAAQHAARKVSVGTPRRVQLRTAGPEKDCLLVPASSILTGCTRA